jgi:hypothetical protein
MVRTPYRPLAAILALTAMSLPVALLSGRTALAASAAIMTAKRAAQPAGSVAITITSMTPQQAGPGSTITVKGTLQNVSQHQIGSLSVRLLSSGMRLTDVAQLQPSASEAGGLAGPPVPGASSVTVTTGQLTPGAAPVPWSIHFKASAIGMTAFGVYPLTAQARSALTEGSVATSTTYLPYVPAKKGPDGSTIPARTKISWVWPLIDTPLLSLPGQNVCQDPRAKALAASLASGGRLGQLVAAGSNGARTAITWAVDPALLHDVKALGACGSSEPKMAAAARKWLASLGLLSAGQPLFFTPYGDPDVAALIGAGHYDDVRKAFLYGRLTGKAVMKQAASPAAGSGARAAHGLTAKGQTAEGQTAESQTAGIAWPYGGIPGNAGRGTPAFTVLENLAYDGIQTLLLGSSYLPTEHVAVLRTLNGGVRAGGYMNILLANESLTQLLGPGSTGDSAFASAQAFLAATALLAQEGHGEPIVVSPPQRWAPAPHLAASVLALTASASWLSPVSLGSLTSAKNLPTLSQSQLPPGPRSGKLNPGEGKVLNRVENKIVKLDALRAKPDQTDFFAVAAAESSAWHGKSQHAALNALRALGQRIRQQLRQGVQIEAEQRFTLGGLKGSVPVSIDNTLSYPVAVRVGVQYDSSSGIKITISPGGVVSGNGLVTIQARSVVTVHLRVQATQVGATAVMLSLENGEYEQLPGSPTGMTIQATQVGVLGVIIFAVALGFVLIAMAARAARRGSPAAGTEQATDSGLAPEQADDRPARLPEPDTVMAERTELGAAGTPGRE